MNIVFPFNSKTIIAKLSVFKYNKYSNVFLKGHLKDTCAPNKYSFPCIIPSPNTHSFPFYYQNENNTNSLQTE